MNIKRAVYWTALAVVGLSAVSLRIWAFSTWSGGQGWAPWRNGPHFPPFWFPVLGVLLVVGAALWYGRQSTAVGSSASPWEALGMEYVEGRITRDEFLARRAVLEEQRWT